MKSKIYVVASYGWKDGSAEGGPVIVPKDSEWNDRVKADWLALCSRCVLFTNNRCTGMINYLDNLKVPVFAIVHADPTSLLNKKWYSKNISNPSECDVPLLPTDTTYDMLTMSKIERFHRN